MVEYQEETDNLLLERKALKSRVNELEHANKELTVNLFDKCLLENKDDLNIKLGHKSSSARDSEELASVNLRIATLLKQKDQEVEELKKQLDDNQQLEIEVEELARILQETQETLKIVAKENTELKVAVIMILSEPEKCF